MRDEVQKLQQQPRHRDIAERRRLHVEHTHPFRAAQRPLQRDGHLSREIGHGIQHRTLAQLTDGIEVDEALVKRYTFC